nr:immunoglobulin heavy chain junction region [Mus musculus]MBK4195011.1 immunoglobulin heavy chain junction region [Mus musculus]
CARFGSSPYYFDYW